MSVLKLLKRIFFRKKAEEEQAIEGDSKRFEALQSIEQRFESPIESIEALEQRFKALQSLTEKERLPQKLEIERDSLQLGVVAGYAGKALKEIESSLQRLEEQVPTKEWLQLNLANRLDELIKTFQTHDFFVKEKMSSIESILLKLHELAEKIPQPYKEEIGTAIKEIEEKLPLTPRMEKLIEIVREEKEISYEELAKRLGISISALRGLLSITIRRTDQIERFCKNGKGWVRFKAL